MKYKNLVGSLILWVQIQIEFCKFDIQSWIPNVYINRDYQGFAVHGTVKIPLHCQSLSVTIFLTSLPFPLAKKNPFIVLRFGMT